MHVCFHEYSSLHLIYVYDVMLGHVKLPVTKMSRQVKSNTPYLKRNQRI